MNPMYPGYYGYNPMMAPQQQRLADMEQQYPQFAPQSQMQPQMNQMNQQPIGNIRQNFIKCRAVTSIDEAKASMIDLDGSIHVFTDIGNKKIYTKQINLDGTATLNTYQLMDAPQEPEPAPIFDDTEYVKHDELETICRQFGKQISDLTARLRDYERMLEEAPKPATREVKGGTKK